MRVQLRVPLSGDAAFLPWRLAASQGRPALPTGRVLAVAQALQSRPGELVLGGGEPLLRPDLARLLGELAQLRPAGASLYTAGEGMNRGVAQRLRELGLQRVHVPFHCARQDAHDWLYGRRGALKSAHRAIRACVDADLPVVADIVLTRPTTAHLTETVIVLARLGVAAVTVRRLREEDAPEAEFVPLSPRLDFVRDSIEAAAAAALERRMALVLRDFPLCTAPRLRPLFAARDSELWATAAGGVRATPAAAGCAECPGPPRCAGAPADYVARFGWEEIAKEELCDARVAEDVAQQQSVPTTAPMAFAWRGPHRVRCEHCGDVPCEKTFEDTRAIRARLVQAARYRPALLRLVGADMLAHPQAAQLLYDSVRLFPRVEVAGEASPVVNWTDLDLRRIKDLGRFDVVLYGPDAVSHDAHCGIPGAFAATTRAVARLRDAKIAVGAYAVLHDARFVPALAAAWGEGRLPGEPRFRLSAHGATLQELAQCAAALPAGAARDALVALLPRCLCAEAGLQWNEPVEGWHRMAEQRAVQGGRSVAHQPCGSDPIGAFEPCREEAGACALAGCPGRAAGWQDTARSQRWSGSI